jgi:hypothetical protein
VSLLRQIVEGLRFSALGLLSAMLPSPERDRLRRDHGVDPPSSSLTIGIAETAAGALLFLAGGIAWSRGGAGLMSSALLENWWPGLSTTHFQGTGLIGWLSWFLHPEAWLYGFVGLTGMVRCVAFAATREAVAEPVVWAALRGYQALRRRSWVKERERLLGPPRPDRIVEAPDGSIVVLTCRDKPEWNESVTIEVDERFYRLDGIEDRADGEWQVIAYRLRPQKEGEVFRTLVHYNGVRSCIPTYRDRGPTM